MHRPRPRRFGQRGTVLLLALLVLALALRLPSITAPPLDFAPARQTYGALRARIIYLDATKDVQPWRRRVLENVRPTVPQIEPPVLEHLAAAGYVLLGSEQIWFARVLSILFWLSGAIFLYRLAHRVSETPGPVIAICLYLFLPFSIFASRSFQPDPLMVALVLAALLAIVRFHENPSWVRFAGAAGVSALAVLAKPPFAAFFLLAAFYSLAIAKRGAGRALRSRDALAFAALSLAPAALYYLYGVTEGGYLRGRTSSSLQPRLLVEADFWRGWLRTVTNVVTYPVGLSGYGQLVVLGGAAAALVAGIRWASSRHGRSLLIGLWVGYAIMGLLFTVHISTHGYYSLPLVPILALSLAPVGSAALRRIGDARVVVRGFVVALAIGCLLAPLAWKVGRKLESSSYAAQARNYEHLGALVDHTPHAVHVDPSYDTPLLYYAWIASVPLYYPGGDQPDLGALRARLCEIASSSGDPRYLLVTATGELEGDGGLRELVRPLPVVAQTSSYVIYAYRPEQGQCPASRGGHA